MHLIGGKTSKFRKDGGRNNHKISKYNEKESIQFYTLNG